ncbi:MAG: ShlB/FhaC/HecB family hemolysin secretion/activation protein [Bacteroidota bacterium]|nr:ShlB/FhaC/HecB family hemolysin secretion/activation protein [Bacteroidota bacterium]
MKLLSVFILSLFAAVLQGNAQTDSVAAAGSKFSTSGGRYFWMGRNYRQEWNTPVKAPVINLATEKGGLTPIKKGGGKQTKSLRLEDASGKQYTLRSIQKYVTSKTLPADLQSDAAVDLVTDGVSASYPYASLSMAILADAAGVPYGKVKLVYIGDDPKLGEFREDFANTLNTFEEKLPAGVTKDFDTEEVADKLEKDNDNDVDQGALLNARILDMFVMDLDRHEGQWNWGARDNANGKGKTYFPIPKDRDQAFYINQGLLPGLVKGRSLVPQLEGFKPAAKSISRFNFAARNLDRFFLNQLTEQEWRTAAENFVAKMTDDVIDKAMLQQPAEIRAMSSGKIADILKVRRNNLVAEVMEYYAFITQTVSINGSDKKELFDITRNADGSTLVQVYKIDKDGAQSTKMYERKFEPLLTKELRLYGMDGEDKFVIHGDNDKAKIRLIGGGDADIFQTDSKQKSGVVYDRTDGGNTVTGRFTNKMSNDSAVNSFDRLGYKYPFQSVFVTLGFNPDDGVLFGPTFKYIRHGFRKLPYKSLHQFKALYAFSTKALYVKYNNEFIGVIGKKTDLLTDIEYRGPNNTTNFFGYGVSSIYDKTQTGRFRFYRIRYDLGDISLQLRHRFSEKVMLSFGPTFQFYSMDPTDKLNKVRNVVLNTVAAGLNPATIFDRQSYFGVRATFVVDTRDNKVLPSKGINWVSTVKNLKGLNDNSYDNVTQINSDFAFYINLVKDRLTFANRIGGGITSGDLGKDFEFFHAQYLGSDDNLRGYRRERFAGKSKFYNQAELRWRLANFKTYLFPAAFGVVAFIDAGRVWKDEDTDKKMFTGYGGGVWFSPLRRLLITVSYAMSEEDNIPVVSIGWRF